MSKTRTSAPKAKAATKIAPKTKARSARADDATIDALVARLDAATKGLRGVTRKRLFGCEGYFAGGEKIFAMVWKEGSVALKLPDPAAFDAVMALAGSKPWMPGAGRGMPHYVLLADAASSNAAILARWTRVAHDLVVAANAAKKK